MKTPAEEFNAAVGRQMKGEISAAGSSIAAMAREIGIARSALDNYTTGKRSIPVPILYAVSASVGIDPHLMLSRAEERLSAEGARRGAIVTPLPRRTDDVPGMREDAAEVAFHSPVGHEGDSDDLYR